MVATTFAADTPLAVTGIVAAGGIAGNWFWWSYACSGILTVFIFSRLWRKLGVTTDAEFTEVRYEGTPAIFLRIFRAFYFAIPINTIIMGWVGLGMSKVIHVAFGWPKTETFLVLYVFTGFYVILSGLWGVILTDFFQFFIAMTGSFFLAWFAVEKFGSLAALKAAYLQVRPESSLSINPFSFQIAGLTAGTWLFVQWWSSWFAGAEPGGGGYIAQRIFSTRDENEAVKASLLFNVLHYVARPWPWIIVAIASLALYPDLADPELGYPKLMVELLPAGFLGLLIVSFMAAYMSTLSTHLNWGASYLVNDVYKRFLRPGASDREYIIASRLAIALLLVITYIISSQMESIKGAWELLISIGSGTGLVYMMRWFWKRINPWSEISAMSSAFAVSIFLKIYGVHDISLLVLINTSVTTLVWTSVTLFTNPVSDPLWIRFRRRAGLENSRKNWIMLKMGILGVISSLAGIFTMLTGFNDLFFYSTGTAVFKLTIGTILIIIAAKITDLTQIKIGRIEGD